jgi:peptidoglycan hydrolase CwlO-like protein
LDQETVLHQFGELEKKIEHLIDRCKQLETARSELEQRNQQLAAQLEEKIMAEQKNHDLKSLIRSKIDSLMGRLDEFTNDQEENR